MPKFLPSCYQQGRGQGHTLCSRNPLFPTNHVAREKDHDLSPNPWCSCHRLATCVQICANMHSINHSSVEFEYSHIDMNLHIPMFAKVSEFLIPPFIGCVKCVCQKIGYTHLYIPSGKFTCWPWKWPIYSGFTSLPTPMTASVYVNIPEGSRG